MWWRDSHSRNKIYQAYVPSYGSLWATKIHTTTQHKHLCLTYILKGNQCFFLRMCCVEIWGPRPKAIGPIILFLSCESEFPTKVERRVKKYNFLLTISSNSGLIFSLDFMVKRTVIIITIYVVNFHINVFIKYKVNIILPVSIYQWPQLLKNNQYVGWKF